MTPICGRCDLSIRPGEPHTKHEIHSASGGGHTVYWHEKCPKPGDRR